MQYDKQIVTLKKGEKMNLKKEVIETMDEIKSIQMTILTMLQKDENKFINADEGSVIKVKGYLQQIRTELKKRIDSIVHLPKDSTISQRTIQERNWEIAFLSDLVNTITGFMREMEHGKNKD